MEALAAFQPAVRSWFARRFPEGPTPPQSRGWPAIAAGGDTLIAAPTGSGKTLAAFLVSIDRLLAEAVDGPLPDATSVVYVSPLKALAGDIQQNLERPLAEIRALARERGTETPDVRVQVRTGDTPPSARAAMLRRPPHIVVTTPESLYLLVTALRSRDTLRQVRTVIVDEIHAVAPDKRGAHLALTLERLEALAERRPQRIGLSATQRPIATVARLLVGARTADPDPGGPPACAVIDLGHQRDLDLAIELPGSELAAVMSHEQWGEILDRIALEVRAHRTTLVFVNTRRLAERVAHLLGDRVGGDRVAAHHGSLSRDRRFRLEERLRAGDLDALVATASLELGIDIGPVECVCQIGSPRSLARCLQRVGRSGHGRGATPRGRLYPTTRDELVESAALLRGVRAGHLDAVRPPVAPLDILAQHVVAACVAEPWNEDTLYALVRRATPYADLTRDDFDAVVDMVSDGVLTGRGRRGAHLHRDRVNGVLQARRAARIDALTSGGAIPDSADYRVLADPDDQVVGTVNEDWAIESMAGDIFLLGSTSWRIRRVESGIVRVVDAGGAPPSVPFWLGEAPARTAELSAEVSALRAAVDERLAAGDPAGAEAWIVRGAGTSAVVAREIVRYLGAAHAALGLLPTARDLVFERFFDESGGMQLVIHAPLGGRVNRALGLALRKRFCRRFDFELQAAASDDAVVLSLGPHQSLPLDEIPAFLSPARAADTLGQALLASPMFQVRWRWNVSRALLVLRQRGGRRNPPPIQRMEADDLMVSVFPAFTACPENLAAGPVELPDHPMIRQTMHDCLHDATDVDGLVGLLGELASGSVRAHFRESPEPSPLAHEILNSRPYTFLDDAPLEERRTRAVAMRRGLPATVHELGALDAEAVARVREEARPEPRDAEELHDLLVGLVVLTPAPEWSEWFQALARAGRAATVATAAGPRWLATERRSAIDLLFPGAVVIPDVRLPAVRAREPALDVDDAAAAAVRGHLGCLGPCTPAELAGRTALPAGDVEIALARLEAEGVLLRGHFDPARPGIEIAGGAPGPVIQSSPGGSGNGSPLREARGRDTLSGTESGDVLSAGMECLPSGAGSRDDARGAICEPGLSGAPEDESVFPQSPEESVQGPEGEGTPQARQAERALRAPEVCERGLLARIHRYTTARLRREIEPVTALDLLRFLFRWQHVAPGRRFEGRPGLLAAVEQLQGFEIAAGAWEDDVLPARVEGYRQEWLDDLCLSGVITWARLGLRPTSTAGAEQSDEAAGGEPPPARATDHRAHHGEEGPVDRARISGPTRATPLALLVRDNLPWLLAAARGPAVPIRPAEGPARAVLDCLELRGALFYGELVAATGRPAAEVEEGLRELVARGLVTADGFASVRALMRPRDRWARRAGAPPVLVSRLRRRALPAAGAEGRWSLLPAAPARADVVDGETLAEAVAEQLLVRYGVVFRDLVARETLAVPWREILWALRRLEARGVVRGGRFVTGFTGEQYALPEAVENLRQTRRDARTGEHVRVSGADPLNLIGILTPGPRVAAVRTTAVVYRDGLPVGA